jgi:pimeloyl-ACP methyl ester carboxylesterase
MSVDQRGRTSEPGETVSGADEEAGAGGGKFGALKAIGMAGALLGVAAAGAAAGVVAERYTVGRQRHRSDDPYVDEPFGQLEFDAQRTVIADGGVPLYVEVVEPDDTGEPPDLTVVFVHGFCLDMGTWHFQRRALTELNRQRRALAELNTQGQGPDGRRRAGSKGRRGKKGVGPPEQQLDPRCRLIFCDQPGHGRSGRRDAGDYDLDQLGADLEAVIAEIAPEGPLVLAGHSMGGMTVMALAERVPQLFADRVVGIALISTSAGHLDDVGLGIPPVLARWRKPLMPTISGALKWQPEIAEVGRRAGSDLAYVLTRRYGFGSKDPSPALIEYVERMNASTSIEVIAAYLGTLSEHARYAALEVFDGIETLVVCGDKDLLTPVEHTREIARLLPGAELVEVADGGHVTLMEHADLVNAHFVAFLRRSARSASGEEAPVPDRKGRRDEIAARAARRGKAAQAGAEERRTLWRILRRRGA